MKNKLKALTAVVLAAAVLSADISASAGVVYDDSPFDDDEYYCIVKLESDPLSSYDYAKQNGVDEFIFTDAGQVAYNVLASEHEIALDTISGLLGREIDVYYDYTAVYNGFSVILKESEYLKLYDNIESAGIKEIWKLLEVDRAAAEPPRKVNASNSYSDLTDDILERTGISKVDHKGDSMVIAIIDNEFDTDHEFISTMPEGAEGRLTQEYIESISPYLSDVNGTEKGFYLNEKIPYRFNYENHTADTTGLDFTDEFHGTHVAGIAAGNGEAETDVTFDPKGAAPDAQLVLMRSSFRYEELLAAMDDCAYIGADVINGSLGSPGTLLGMCTYMNEAVQNITDTGVVCCFAAGNEAKTNFTGLDSVTNTDYATIGYPSNTPQSISVANAENTVYAAFSITAGGKKYSIMPGLNSLIEAFPDKEVSIAVVPGMGYPEDFENVNVSGKIAVISRGEITFEEKAENAKAKGAKGVLFCNNVPLEDLFVVSCSLPSAVISYEDSKALIESGASKITVNTEATIFADQDSHMSSSSSWGCTEELALKPDITAYGGNIISSVPDGKYGISSGTSMATPQMSGAVVLMKEYLQKNKEKYGIESDSDYPKIISNLLMSTAIPAYNSESNAVASPRIQGSGIVNVENAINSPAYLYTDSEKDAYRPKLSLGDKFDLNMGKIEFKNNKFYFHIKNISDESVTYKLSADLMRDDVNENGLTANTVLMPKGKVSFSSSFVDTSTVTVGPGEDITVNIDVKLDTYDIKFIDANFENGTFIDGFVYLKSDTAPTLSLPFTGFYGSWSDAEIIDQFIYAKKRYPNPSIMTDQNGNYAGFNNMALKFEDETIKTSIPLFSPNGDNVMDNIALLLCFKRRCSDVTAEIYKSGKKVYTEKHTESYGYNNGESNSYLYYPVNWDFDGVQDNELYSLKLTAKVPYSEGKTRTEIISQEFRIDLTPPEIKSCKIINIGSGKDKTKRLLLKASDNNLLQGGVISDGEHTSYSYTSAQTINKDICLSMDIPDSTKGYYVEVYDMAGNKVSESLDNMLKKADNTYDLEYADNMFFSTNDKTFGSKIKFSAKNSSNAQCTFSTTPKLAYQNHVSEITVYIDSVEFETVPVTVGLAGDSNLDKKTDLLDVIMIAKYILWESNPNGALKETFRDFKGTIKECLADYDRNDKIDLLDAIAIAKLLVKQT